MAQLSASSCCNTTRQDSYTSEAYFVKLSPAMEHMLTQSYNPKVIIIIF